MFEALTNYNVVHGKTNSDCTFKLLYENFLLF